MLKELLKDWNGTIEIDGNSCDVQNVSISRFNADTCMILRSANKKACKASQSVTDTLENVTQYKITVKAYMTRPATPEFDFMSKWNNNVPMPLRTMVGTVEKETRGMVYMKLHGEAEPVVTCLRCGRILTNPVSKMYGIGPECITKIPFIMNLDMNDVEGIKKKLVDVTWEGWIIKSAITKKEEL